MTITAKTISKMTLPEKLRLMEDLWADLSKDEKSFKWPSWHAEELARREALAKKGQNQFSSLKEVKKRLREKLS